REDWRRWRRRFRSALVRLLGPQPPRCRPALEVLARERLDGYVRERIVFNPDPFSSIPCYVLIPDGLSRGERRPAVLCAHGHGIFRLPAADPRSRRRAALPGSLVRAARGRPAAHRLHGLFVRRHHDHLHQRARPPGARGGDQRLPQHHRGRGESARTRQHLRLAVPAGTARHR
ncbi:MAG: hypothetical protein H0W83_13480, partial [Planctomycetes bacterium]|nr:hypothetical protein [Planctomycetota bacterium]